MLVSTMDSSLAKTLRRQGVCPPEEQARCAKGALECGQIVARVRFADGRLNAILSHLQHPVSNGNVTFTLAIVIIITINEDRGHHCCQVPLVAPQNAESSARVLRLNVCHFPIKDNSSGKSNSKPHE